MMNFPGETIETTEKTIALARELDLDFVVLGNQSFCAGNLTWQLHQIILEEIEDYKKTHK